MYVLDYKPSKTTKAEQSVEQLMATGEPLYPHTIKEPLFDFYKVAMLRNPNNIDNSDKQIEDAIKKWQSEPQELKFVPDVDKYIDTEGWEVFGQKAFEYANKLKAEEFWKLYNELIGKPAKLTFPIYNKESGEDVFDITTMD
jgi:hypothetical protein